VLIDFGSARRLGSPQPPGRPVGTVGYAAPEMETCEPVSAAMDLFGLGTVLVEAITGEPFPDAPKLPRSRLSRLLRQLLADNPGERGTTSEVLIRLAAASGVERPWPEWLDRQADDAFGVTPRSPAV
jgi:serine/threonine protein kinase